MKQISIACLLSVALAFTAGCPSSKSPSNADATSSGVALTFEYKDATYPFRFKVPEDWTCQEKYENAVVAAFAPADKDGRKPNVNVVVMPSEPALLDMKKENFETLLKMQEEGYTLTFFEKTTLGNHEALHIKLALETEQTGALTQEQYIFNAGRYAYAITCSASHSTYSDMEKTFKAVLESFEFE